MSICETQKIVSKTRYLLQATSSTQGSALLSQGRLANTTKHHILHVIKSLNFIVLSFITFYNLGNLGLFSIFEVLWKSRGE
jgi:hypothetical protein